MIKYLKIKGVNSTNCRNKSIYGWCITQHRYDGRDIIGLYHTRDEARKELRSVKFKYKSEYKDIMYKMHKFKLHID